MSEKVVFERKKTKNGWWGTIRDAEGRSLLHMATRGYATSYSKDEVGEKFNNIIAAVREGNFETRDA